MNWIQSLSKAIRYIEDHLVDDIHIDDVSDQVYTSISHFQFIFHVVMGLTVNEYIRNRRLSLAAQDLLQSELKIIEVAMRYHYDTQESFSKAFTRFHGVPPSKIQPGQARFFHPLTINITIQGGFGMSQRFMDEFHLIDWSDIKGEKDGKLTDAEKYKRIVRWAQKAREKNPDVFDALTEWIRDDSQWTDDKLAENEQILIHGVFARFKEQNARLRAYLKELEPSGVVNTPVFSALDRFDDELSGLSYDERVRETVAPIFTDFSKMRDRSVREIIAGNKTGPTGTDSVDVFGFINYLKDCDAQIQWTLFMPDVVEKQQNGFKVDSFEYKNMSVMRFIGKESSDADTMEDRRILFRTLGDMDEYKSVFDYDILLLHHYGLGLDINPCHCFWGRFMKMDAPVPEGFVHFDFVPLPGDKAGLPYCSQFAYAVFSGDNDAMHKREGYDSDAMYDVTRNIILGQGVMIPYPEKYWTAEVFLEGFEKDSTAYMFSVKL